MRQKIYVTASVRGSYWRKIRAVSKERNHLRSVTGFIETVIKESTRMYVKHKYNTKIVVVCIETLLNNETRMLTLYEK